MNYGWAIVLFIRLLQTPRQLLLADSQRKSWPRAKISENGKSLILGFSSSSAFNGHSFLSVWFQPCLPLIQHPRGNFSHSSPPFLLLQYFRFFNLSDFHWSSDERILAKEFTLLKRGDSALQETSVWNHFWLLHQGGCCWHLLGWG